MNDRLELYKRAKVLNEQGWELIVIWGSELKSLREEAILAKINSEGRNYGKQ